MTKPGRLTSTLPGLDDATRRLVRLAAVVSSGTEPEIRAAMASVARGDVPPEWVEELVLQTYLFAGFPRGLNAMREWRRASGRRAPERDEGERPDIATWTREGERTCRIVYGRTYERLRVNIRDLHPALDTWMIVEGYGKVLSRSGLDLNRRELCVVAACAVLGQERQLHSHLHGALNAGATAAEVDDALDVINDMLAPASRDRIAHLWARVRRE
ncbi:MAG: carboxymuconolactone decarboxylase family protein [Gemmatimonadaceae bacterium]